jgi:3-isopropylmalate dehydratase small subunit
MAELNTVLRGRVWKFGDSIDTGQMVAGGKVSSDGGDNLKENCLVNVRPEFARGVRPGDILVAGANFGCGSARTSAVHAMHACGVAAVVAESVARIYLRNSIALALPIFVVPGITQLVEDGDSLEIDYAGGVLRALGSGRTLALAHLPASVEQIYRAGGIGQVIARELASRGIVPD